MEDLEPEKGEYKNEDLLPEPGISIKKHLKSIRLFNGCTDENGFILVHVAIST